MIYATSDIHGYPLDSFLSLLESAGFGDSDHLYVLGDVIDRNGDGGVAMLRWMMNRPNVELIRGNHEDMLLNCAFLFDEITDDNIDRLSLRQLELLLTWMQNGAEPTICSLRELGEKDRKALTDLLDYLRRAPLYMRTRAGGKEYLLVHSGLDHFSPDKELSEYRPHDLLWCRPSPDEEYFPDITTILGHTPTGYMFGKRGQMFRTDTWIDIDTGAAIGGSPMLLRLDDLKEFYCSGNEKGKH